MKGIQIISILLTFIVVFASAEISIIYPSKEYYLVAGKSNQVLWTSEAGDPKSFSVYLTNPKIVELKQYALANNVVTSLGKKDVEISENFVGPDFQIMFTNIGNITQNYALSDVFEIKPNGTEPIVYTTPTPTPSSTSTSTDNSTKGTKDDSKQNSSSSIHNGGFGILVLITLITMIFFN